MKKITFCLILFLFQISIYGQQRYQGIPLEENEDLERIFEEYEAFKLDLKGLYNDLTSKENNIILELSKSHRFNMILTAHEMKSPFYSENIHSSEGVNGSRSTKTTKTFKGKLLNGGLVRLTISEDFIYGIIETPDRLYVLDQMKYVTKQNILPADEIVLYPIEKIINDGGECGTDESEINSEKISTTSTKQTISTNCRILEVATDADFEYFQIYGSNSNNRIIGEFNNIQGVYSNIFNLDMVIVEQNVWTTSNDPYNSTDGATIISEINNTWQNNFAGVERDLVHMFTGKNLGTLIGRASGIGNLCINQDANSFTVDRQAAFRTTGHEIGHNLNGIHGDGELCSTANASVMCQGEKAIPIYFSNASVTRISNYINSNSGCLHEFNNISEINGDGNLCSTSTKTYTIDIPTEASIIWSLTNSYASIVSGQGTSSVSIQGQNDGNVQLKATVDLNGEVCNNIIVTKSLQVGTIVPADIRMRDPYSNMPVYTLCRDQPTEVKAAHDAGVIPNDWQWNITGAYLTYNYSYSDHSRVTIRPYSSYVSIQLRAQNECGWSDWIDVSPGIINCGGTYSVSPNPASSNIKVKPKNTNISYIKEDVTLELYNLNGQKMKSKRFSKTISEIELSIADLPKGIYILKVISGSKQESHKIIKI